MNYLEVVRLVMTVTISVCIILGFIWSAHPHKHRVKPKHPANKHHR